MLLLINKRDTKNNKRQENDKFSYPHDNIQDIKDVQHKIVNMTLDYCKFNRHPVSA